jgi:hypothetical protein
MGVVWQFYTRLLERGDEISGRKRGQNTESRQSPMKGTKKRELTFGAFFLDLSKYMHL